MVVFIGLLRFHRGFCGLWWKMLLFISVYYVSPGFLHIFECQIDDFNVYLISPTFLGCFQKIAQQIPCAFSAPMQIAGIFACRWCPFFQMDSVQNLRFSMFIRYHRGFRDVFTSWSNRNCLFFLRWCISQGKSPSLSVVAFSWFFIEISRSRRLWETQGVLA